MSKLPKLKSYSIYESLKLKLKNDWLIKNILPAKTLGCLTAPSRSYKTFMALSMGICIASGKDWQGIEVKQGLVVYIAGESFYGIPKRLKAAIEYLELTKAEVEEMPFEIISVAVFINDTNYQKSLKKKIKAIEKKHNQKVSLVIIDTLNKNFGVGDESSTRDMTLFLNGIDSALKSRITKMIVHHTGKDLRKGGRGSSALFAALEYEFIMNANQVTRIVSLFCKKMRDYEEFQEMFFKMEYSKDSIVPVQINFSEVPIEITPLKITMQMQKMLNEISSFLAKEDKEGITLDELEAIRKETKFYSKKQTMEDSLNKLRDNDLLSFDSNSNSYNLP